jgi:hypothetical protein
MKKIQFLLLLLIYISFPVYGENQSASEPAASEKSAELDFSQIEQDVIRETNLARTNPKAYAEKLKEFLKLFDGRLIRIPGKIPLMTQEGVRPVKEAIVYLMKVEPVEALAESKGITLAARDHVNDQAAKGTIGHYGSNRSTPFDRMKKYGKIKGGAGENIAYGFDTGELIVMALIIDDGVPDRGHRTNIFKKTFKVTGVGFGTHPTYRNICVIGYAVGFEDKE